MSTIWDGIGFAIGLVTGLVAIFYSLRWLRFAWWTMPWVNPEMMPLDVRQKILRSAIIKYQKDAIRMTPEERQQAGTQMLSAALSDTPMDVEMQDELVKAAMEIWS